MWADRLDHNYAFGSLSLIANYPLSILIQYLQRLNFVATTWRLTVAAVAAAFVVAAVSADQLIYNEYQVRRTFAEK